jgi:hypothetical protein
LNELETLHSRNPTKYWKMLDELRQTKSDSVDSDVIQPTEWFHYFNDLFSKDNSNMGSRDDDILSKISDMEKSNIFNELNYLFKESEVSAALTRLPTRKAVASDGIANEMLRVGAEYFCKPLTIIFNAFYSKGEYPLSWCQGIIATIFKSGNPVKPENYRGITLCSNLSKVFSSILNFRLLKFIEDNKMGVKEQIGFKKKARTADHIFALKTIIDVYAKKKGDRVYACFVDFKKAFDTVWWNGLFFKLLKMGIGGNFYHTIKSMYTTVSSCVKTRLGVTHSFNIFQGVKQGEVLSPALFSIYVNDLPQVLN